MWAMHPQSNQICIVNTPEMIEDILREAGVFPDDPETGESGSFDAKSSPTPADKSLESSGNP